LRAANQEQTERSRFVASLLRLGFSNSAALTNFGRNAAMTKLGGALTGLKGSVALIR
jgi:hypothetical protein